MDMRERVGWTLSIALIAPIEIVSAVAAPSWGQSDERPSVDEIIARTIEAQRLHEEAGNEVRYDYELVSTTETLDKEGDVKKVEKDVYRSHHIEGLAYERLVEKNGRALSEKETKKEAKREKKFRDKIREGKARHNDADDRVEFNEELLSRYEIELESVQSLAGHECYVLWFEPKPGKLPVRRTVDRALNKAEGRLWIDTDSFEIVRIEFDLRDTVRLWWGMMGSVSRMSGKLQRQVMEDGIWLPARFDFYLKGRMLFRSIHVRQAVSWNGFEKRAGAVASDR